MSGLKIFLLGSPLVERGGETVSLDRKKALALLAYLALSAQNEERAALASVFWPDQDRARALGSLRRALRSLTIGLGPKRFAASRSSIGLRHEPDLWVDVREFEKLAGRKPSPQESSPQVWRAAMPDLEKAVELYRGDFLAGFTLRDSDAFDEWQFLQTERLRSEQHRVLESLVLGAQTLGDFDLAVSWAQRWLSLDQLAEEVHRTLMRLHCAAGRRSEALRQYELCVEILREQLEVEPEPETQQLHARIRGGEPVLPGLGAVQDGLRQQEQPATGAAAGADSPFAQSEIPALINNLPDSPTPLVGRGKELQTVAELLSEPFCRLLTLVGPGGIGKTRLALEAARLNISHFAHGVCFVALAAGSASRAVAAITEALGLALDPQGDAETQLLAFLADKNLLLLLDNFEHILERTPLVATMLARAPNLRILVTSRARLNLQGEWLLEIKGLQAPDKGHQGDIDGYPAVKLFLQAAQRVERDFAVAEKDRAAVIEICNLLEGMPLGIELAAAWLRLMSCEDIAEEIRGNLDFLTTTSTDLPERHRSLRAVFNSSAGLLSEEERDVLSGLSAFEGGFTLEAAGQVAGASLSDVASLMDKSLIGRAANRRFQIHELIRQFALELLKEKPERLKTVKTRHSACYLQFLAARAESLRSETHKAALEEIHPEVDNIRAAWKWAIENRLEDLIEQALEGIDRLYLLSNWYAEAEEILEGAAKAVSKSKSPLLWGKVASRLSRFCIRQWRYRKATALLDECLPLFREAQDDRELALILASLSSISFHLGEFDNARSQASESVSLWRGIGDPLGTADSLIQMGRLAGVVGQYEESVRLLTESYSLFESLADQSGMGRCLTNLGVVTYICRDHAEAIRLFEEGLRIAAQIGDRRGMAFCLANMGLVYEELGDHLQAKQTSKKALDIFLEIGYQKGNARARKGPAAALENLGRATFGLGEYDESSRYFQEALKAALENQAVPQALLSLVGLARLFGRFGDPVKAWELLAFASTHPAVSTEIKLQAKDVKAEVQNLLTPKKRAEAEKVASAKKLDQLSEEVLRLIHQQRATSPATLAKQL